MTPLNKPPNHEDLRQLLSELTSSSFRGWDVDDQPYVKGENFDDVDAMLSELDRRLYKSGRLEEHEQSQSFTKPSEEKRMERQAQAHRAETGNERRWRGGVQR